VRQEDICFDDFIANRFGRNYINDNKIESSAESVSTENTGNTKKIA